MKIGSVVARCDHGQTHTHRQTDSHTIGSGVKISELYSSKCTLLKSVWQKRKLRIVNEVLNTCCCLSAAYLKNSQYEL